VGIYRGVKLVLWPKVGLRGPTCQAGRPARVVGRPSFLAAPTLGIGCPCASTFLDTLAKRSLKRRQHLAGRLRRWGRSVGPTLAQLGSESMSHLFSRSPSITYIG
jgi:hypothetical protein